MKKSNGSVISRIAAGVFLLAAAPVILVAQQTHTVNFACTGFTQYFVVPADVTQIKVAIAGAAGGNGIAKGGLGDVSNGVMTVAPNDILMVEVGCQPSSIWVSAIRSTYNSIQQGGYGYSFGGSGGSEDTSGGGGSSGIRAIGAGLPRLVVAGGGGGGHRGFGLAFYGGNGGKGGDRNQSGNPGDRSNGGNGGPSTGGGGSGGQLILSATGGDGQPAQNGLGAAGGGGGGGLYLYDLTGGGGGGDSGPGATGGGGGGGGVSSVGNGFSSTDPAGGIAGQPGVVGQPNDGSVTFTFASSSYQPTAYSCTGAESTYTIPVGTKQLIILAIGAMSGASVSNSVYGVSTGKAGLGSSVSAKIPAADFPADGKLVVAAGCQGGAGQTGDWFGSVAAGGQGGYGIFPGGNGGPGDKLWGNQPADGGSGGGGGGGASGVAIPGQRRFPLITAGGGGGGGGWGSFAASQYNSGGYGGSGGTATSATLSGADGAGSSGGKGGNISLLVNTRDGTNAAAGGAGGGGGGAGGGVETVDQGITSAGGGGATTAALVGGGGGGMGGLSSPGGGAVPITISAFDASTYWSRGNVGGLVIILPVF